MGFWHEFKSDFIAESVLSLVHNLGDNLIAFSRTTVVELATGSKVLKDLFDKSFKEVMSARKRSIEHIYFGALRYSAIHATAGRA